MRIGRLDLLRYGHFTNCSLLFPQAESDLHVLFGPNEAGKSTSLAAIEDLLFGIPANSPYNFVHAYAAMRVGGVLEHAGETLEIRRRKGNKDTLLAPDDSPLATGDGALAPFLAGADRNFLSRMFSLNHQRLAQGGREILEARNAVGQTLFAAGTGVFGLRERMASLASEAENLWAPRKAAHRKYYMALDALADADSAQREHTVTASKWQEIKRALDDAEEAYKNLDGQFQKESAEQRRLSRIRRVYRQVRRLAEITTEIAGLGEVFILPEDAATQLATATQKQSNAQSTLDELNGQLQQATSECAALQCDETLLARVDDIAELHKQRIEIQKERADLPKRRAELAAKEEQLAQLASDLDWETGDPGAITARIPPRAKIAVARALLTRRGGLNEATRNATMTLEETEGRIREIESELGQMETPRDSTALHAAITVTRGSLDVATRIKAAEKDATLAGAALTGQLQPLRPQVLGQQALEQMPVPPRDVVQKHRDALRDVEGQAQSCRDRIGSAERELTRLHRAFERLEHAEEVVSQDDLERARQERDSGWALVRKHHIDAEEVPQRDIEAFQGDAPDLAAAYQRTVEAADTLADRRFDKAEAAGRIAAMARQVAEADAALAALHSEACAVEKMRSDLQVQWQRLWAEAPFEPLAPEFMLAWLEARTTILDLVAKRTAATTEVTALQDEEADACVALIAELAALGEDTGALQGQRLKVVLETAVAVQRQQEQRAEHQRGAERQVRRLRADAASKATGVQQAQAAWAEWLGQWSSTLQQLGFVPNTAVEVVVDHLDVIEGMRDLSSQINQLQRDRIAKIERDIEGFSGAAMALVREVAPELTKQDPGDAVSQLEIRLEAARRIQDQQREQAKGIASLKKRIKACAQARAAAQATIDRLQALAHAQSPDQLEEAIRVSRHRHALDAEQAAVEAGLDAEGDGLPLAELRAECADVDLDQITTREASLQNEVEDLRNRLMPVAEDRARARQAFAAIGGDGRAARAAAARQEALAAMRDAAERYVRVRTAAMLLQWAIDRYRREQQAPLLKRAGAMFGTLTSGSFTGLRVEYDDKDRAQLAGVRPDESSVAIHGMSDGTADQLYLALRLASVEEYLSRAHALPFVADDLLINFDDRRAAAGFQVLAGLSRSTQVLFFTHHQHLVDVARATLGPGVHVISLAQAQGGPAT